MEQEFAIELIYFTPQDFSLDTTSGACLELVIDVETWVYGADQGCYLMQLDTGADVSILYIEGCLAKTLGLQEKYQAAISHLPVPGRGVLGTETLELVLAREQVLHIPFLVAMGWGGPGETVGTIGIDFLAQRLAVLDYPNRQLRICSDEGFRDCTIADEVSFIPLNPGRPQPVLSVNINGVVTEAWFDTGCGGIDLMVPVALWELLTGVSIGDPDNSVSTANSWNRQIKFVWRQIDLPVTMFGEVFFSRTIHCCPDLEHQQVVLGNGLFLCRRVYFDLPAGRIGVGKH